MSGALELIRNGVALIAVAIVLYFVARLAVRIGDAHTARMLAPLASMIGAKAGSRQPFLLGTYEGYKVQIEMSPGQSVGTGESASSINAFRVKVLDVPGKKDWWLQFHVSGTFGQGPKQLGIGARDDALAERVRLSSAVSEVAAVSAPTTSYITVSYEAFYKMLTYTDDVSPGKLPTRETCAKHLALAVRLAALNQQINPV